MKRLLINIWANILYWLGDLCWNISWRFSIGICWNWYQSLMNKSYQISKKYNLNLWEDVKRED